MKQQLHIIRNGFATFAMFFGAGNILYPLTLGHFAQDMSVFAIWGMLLTAVAIPFTGLVTMTYYDGDYTRFFGRLGRIPGLLLATLIMLLLGPLGSTPRCVALSYSTLNVLFPGLSSVGFCAVACVVLFLCTVRRRRLLDLLGFVLTPLLLATLTFIIYVGLSSEHQAELSTLTASQAFWTGLKEGYLTMDLMAACFFSSVIIAGVHRDLMHEKHPHDKITSYTFKACILGASLLAIVYYCFCLISAQHSAHIEGLNTERMLGGIAVHLLGPYAGIVAAVTISLACLTTAIALISVFAEFVSKTLCRGKVSYRVALLGSILVTFGVSTLELTSILAFLGPVLEVVYPVLILLTLVNLILRKKQPPSQMHKH